MAGYTSRFFLGLTISSVFGFLSVWFLKKKTPTQSKAIQVDQDTTTTVVVDSDEFENRFFKTTFAQMKLKNQENGCEESGSSEMQLKETHQQLPNGNGIQLMNGKSKMREKTCMLPTDYILEDSGDRDISQEDNGISLSNGIESIDLNGGTRVSAKDELLLNAINNKTLVDAEMANSSPITSLSTTTSTEAHNTARSNTTDNPSVQQNGGGSAKEKCDTDVQVYATIGERNSVELFKGNEQQTDLPPTSVQIDSCGPLTLPVVCAETTGEMLESPGATYCDSVGSYDSGTGGSEIHFDDNQPKIPSFLYEFEILQEYVGLLIGKNGRHVNYIKDETAADILIKRHPLCDRKKVCAVTGSDEAVHAALKLIRKRFPIETYPTVTLSQVCLSIPQEIPHADILKLNLPESVAFDVMLCATVNAGHFFLHQPTHPSFHSLPPLLQHMSAIYNADPNAPPLPHLDRGYICAALVRTSWYRAEIDEVFDDTDECRVKFLDFGGYSVLPRANLKQIRVDFMTVPFQASECYLGEVTYPGGETDWSDEATVAFTEIAEKQILQGYICGYAENRIPYVKLFKVTGANLIDINAELVRLGYAESLLPPLSPQEV